MTVAYLIFGPQGSGKSTAAKKLELEKTAIRFSIDEWAVGLFGKDMPDPIDYAWITERVERTLNRIWDTCPLCQHSCRL